MYDPMDDYLKYVYTMTGRDLMDIEASGQTVDDAIAQADGSLGYGGYGSYGSYGDSGNEFGGGYGSDSGCGGEFGGGFGSDGY